MIVAAGRGSRLGAELPKAFVPLAGERLVDRAVRGVRDVPALAQVVVVAPAAFVPELQAAYAAPPHLITAGAVTVVAGGAERTDSVAAGLAALAPDIEVVLVHDAARCLTPPAVFARVIAALAAGAEAVVPGIPVTDTIKIVDGHGHVLDTPDRGTLRAIQTPQGFTRTALERAHASERHASDDAALAEACGIPVLIVEGDPRALKVTTAADLAYAERLLRP